VGDSLKDAVDESIQILKTKKNNKETLAAIDKAVEMVDKSNSGPDLIEDIGATSITIVKMIKIEYGILLRKLCMV